MNHLDLLRLRAPTTKLKKQVFIWLMSLPHSVRPNRLAKEFPHIVNHIVDTWDDFYVCEQYIHNLLYERERAFRQGFGREISDEIRELYNMLLRQALIVSPASSASASSGMHAFSS